ncbi:hypothetical protein P6166_05610 [Stenotrophomonas sp. HITSZ_GD]|uniref:hypothetical protein n=1 Tax=Stenotrophomonas sp. HITSZ_GD TaxID=3037248 RepID=UPI00240D5796|nr:hypothetical protein [Stenotrophomonas sp. HITSZ_GD]MDG2524829.1 hypothetical protein [Stenotrophomonas sp. HITSZ_GD]
MPSVSLPRQAGVSSWFDTGAGRALLDAEQAGILNGLRGRPAQPWLWIAPTAPAGERPALQARGLRLHPGGAAGGFQGDLRCTLPLPLVGESVQSIVLQHVPLAQVDLLLAECERILMPGGRLWVYALNPFSPYRLRWRRHGPQVLQPMRWRALVQGAGLRCLGQAGYLGATWRVEAGADAESAGSAPWRAVCVIEAEKRVIAPVGPIPAVVNWRRPVATI